MLGRLEIIAGPDKGRSFPLHEGLLTQIGRGANTLTQLSDPYVSRQHCQLKVENDLVEVTDLGSSTGTRVNGLRIDAPLTLQSGDVIGIGSTQFLLHLAGLHEEGTIRLPAGQVDAMISSNRPKKPAAAITVKAEPPTPSPVPPEASVLPLLHSHHGFEGDLSCLVGKRLGRFTVDKELARGRSSVVFRASSADREKPVALKVLLPELTEQADLVGRFLATMKAIQPLRHPNLVEIYEADRSPEYCWLAMEFVEGKSLKQVIDGIGMVGILDWRYALRVAIHVTRGLTFALANGFVHRNICPKSILIRQVDNVAKLGDMTMAKIFEGADSNIVSVRGQLVVDLGYMAPERIAETPVADARTDLYELGATIYALLTGRPPCQGTTHAETIEKLRGAAPASTRSVQLSVPESFDKVILKLLAKRPSDRYTRAGELLANLEEIARLHHIAIP